MDERNLVKVGFGVITEDLMLYTLNNNGELIEKPDFCKGDIIDIFVNPKENPNSTRAYVIRKKVENDFVYSELNFITLVKHFKLQKDEEIQFTRESAQKLMDALSEIITLDDALDDFKKVSEISENLK